MTQAGSDMFAGAFVYKGLTAQGEALSGTIDAADGVKAREKLEAMGVRVTEMAPAAEAPRRPRRLRGEDFIAFNQELAQLVQSGLPVEQGLRLVAQDMRSGRLAGTVRAVAEELQKGVPLAEAFERHRGQFPTLYGRLVDAGVRSNNLAAVLLSLGRHLELIQRLRRTLWRAIAYPLMLMIVLMGVLAFIGMNVLPRFQLIFKDFGVMLPGITLFVMEVGRWLPYVAIALGVVLIAIPLLGAVLRATGADVAFVDRVIVPLPIVGTALRKNLIARWCDAVRVGVEAGMDLPGAVELASDAVGSPRLRADGARLNEAMASGRRLTDVRTELLPPVVPAAIELGAGQNSLATTMASLASMYQRQAELRISAIPALLTPILILFLSFVVGVVVLGLFAPLISLIQSVSGGGAKK